MAPTASICGWCIKKNLIMKKSYLKPETVVEIFNLEQNILLETSQIEIKPGESGEAGVRGRGEREWGTLWNK